MSIQKILRIGSEHAPEILTGLGCVGVGVTSFLAGKGAIKASYVYNQLAEYDPRENAQTRKERFQRQMRLARPCVRYFIPAAISGVATVASIIGLRKTMYIRGAAIAASYLAADQALDQLKTSVVDRLGEKKGSELILDSAQKNAIAPPTEIDIPELPESGEETGHEKALIYDAFSGRYFKSSIEHLKRVEADLNAELLKRGWVPVNDIYQAIELDTIDLGEDIGFKFEIDDISSRIDFTFDGAITDEGKPYIIMTMRPKPKWTYYYHSDRYL